MNEVLNERPTITILKTNKNFFSKTEREGKTGPVWGLVSGGLGRI
jgi:hypothetical protein